MADTVSPGRTAAAVAAAADCYLAILADRVMTGLCMHARMPACGCGSMPYNLLAHMVGVFIDGGTGCVVPHAQLCNDLWCLDMHIPACPLCISRAGQNHLPDDDSCRLVLHAQLFCLSIRV